MKVRPNATLGAFATERPWREAPGDETGFSLFRVIRLVLPNSQASVFIQFYFFRIVRFGVFLFVDATAER
jgi:hypothetical protein